MPAHNLPAAAPLVQPSRRQLCDLRQAGVVNGEGCTQT